jgi:hypothetical protein
MSDDEPATCPVPTARDRQNARIREAIAARAAEEYGRVLAWAWGAFGEGWLPSGRHFLASKDAEDARRRDGGKLQAAATVYTVVNDAGDKRHFLTGDDGNVREVASYQEGFGSMLLEPDPARTIELRGQKVHPHRYSLCWAPFELYRPTSAEELAALRVSRERGRPEREQRKFEQENPLLAWAERAKEDPDLGR